MVRFRLLALLATAWGFTCILIAPAAAQQCARMAAVDYARHDGTVQHLRQLYRARQFSQLDETLSCLTRSPERFQSGKSGASAVYWLFRREMPAPGVNPSVSSHLLKWKQERPQRCSSISPSFVFDMPWPGTPEAQILPERYLRRAGGYSTRGLPRLNERSLPRLPN